VAGGDLDVAQVDVDVETGRDESVTQHVRVRPGDPAAGGVGETPQAAGSRVPVHPGTAGVQQDRPAVPEAGRPVDGPADSWRQRDQDDLGTFAADPQHPVAVFLAEIGDVRGGGLEDLTSVGVSAASGI